MTTGPSELHHVEAGSPDGAPALFVHGFLSSRLQWELNLERLGARFRMILVELPGHGESCGPDDPEAYGPPAVLSAIEAIRRSLAIDRWWAVGHSLGGAVTTRYALAHPNRVEGLVITNSRAMFGIDRSERPTVGQGSPTDLRRLPFHPIHAKRFPADLRERMVEVADATPPHVVRHVGTASHRWRSIDELGELAMPTMLVNGRWEKAFQTHAAHVRSHLDHIDVVDLEGGHSINVEQAETFDAAVLDFVDRHRN